MLVLATFSLCIAALVWWRQYRLFTVLEYGVLAALFFYEFPISFSMFQAIKVLISLGVFLLRYASNQYNNLKRIQYLIGSWKNPCHTSIAIGENAYHYSCPDRRGANSSERTSSPTAGKHIKKAGQLQNESFWAPCVGFSVHTVDKENFQNNDNCGKCHDWPTVAVYLLSRDKFLSYSSVIYMRWQTMICVGVNVVLHVLWVLVQKSIAAEYGTHTSSTSTTVGLYILMVVDSLHMIVVAFDVCNFVGSRIDHTDMKSPDTAVTHVVTFVLFMLSIYSYLTWIHSSTRLYGYYIYVAICMITASVVKFSVLGKVTSKMSSNRNHKDHKDQRMPRKS